MQQLQWFSVCLWHASSYFIGECYQTSVYKPISRLRHWVKIKVSLLSDYIIILVFLDRGLPGEDVLHTKSHQMTFIIHDCKLLKHMIVQSKHETARSDIIHFLPKGAYTGCETWMCTHPWLKRVACSVNELNAGQTKMADKRKWCSLAADWDWCITMTSDVW